MTCSGIKVVVDVFGREVREVCLEEGATVRDLIKALGLRVSEVVAAINGEVVAEDEVLPPTARVKLHSVVSGG